MLPQPADFVALWAKIARRYPIVGPKIYDLHLVATMLAYNIHNIYTCDEADFKRYEEIQVAVPSNA